MEIKGLIFNISSLILKNCRFVWLVSLSSLWSEWNLNALNIAITHSPNFIGHKWWNTIMQLTINIFIFTLVSTLPFISLPSKPKRALCAVKQLTSLFSITMFTGAPLHLLYYLQYLVQYKAAVRTFLANHQR